MGLLSWLGFGGRNLPVESPWAPDDVLSRITFEQYAAAMPWLTDPALAPITRAEAMAVPAVAACRHRIVGTLARLPLSARDTAGEDWTRQLGLLTQPDPAEPHTATLARTLDDILFDGCAWWAVVAAYADGRPASIVQVPVCYMTAGTDGPPRPTDDYVEWLRRARDLVILAHPQHPARPWLLHFAGPHDGLLSFGRSGIRAAAAMERAAGKAADNPVPSVELHQTTNAPMTKSEIQAYIDAWAAARRGHNGGVAWTNSAIEARMHGAAVEQLLIDGRSQSAVDMARLAGIPASAIDAGIKGSSITYQNLADRMTDLINMGLQPYATAITSRLSMGDVLPQGVSCTFDYSELYPVTTDPAPAGTPTTQEQPA